MFQLFYFYYSFTFLIVLSFIWSFTRINKKIFDDLLKKIITKQTQGNLYVKFFFFILKLYLVERKVEENEKRNFIEKYI